MTAPLMSSSNPEMLSDLSGTTTASMVVDPWSESAARRLQQDSTDSQTPRRALEQAIEFALVAGQASLQAHGSVSYDESLADDRSDAESAPMRHAYRGKRAYSDWELGARGKRVLVDDLDQVVALEAHLAYLNAASVR
ncbi:MAG: hypothetical protein IT193_09340 [Propionibacteriaceae bacterium]|nr:hypothetical protein [Propionibacteriaceae bacterium]